VLFFLVPALDLSKNQAIHNAVFFYYYYFIFYVSHKNLASYAKTGKRLEKKAAREKLPKPGFKAPAMVDDRISN